MWQILICELGQWSYIDPTYFWQPYIFHFVSFFNNLSGYGCIKSRSKKTFYIWRQKDNVLKFEVLCEQLSVCSSTYLVVVTSEL
jgi:hypothetical protein